MKKALITGITGQDGSYLAEFLLSKNYKVYGLIRRSSIVNFERIAHIQNRIEFISGDLLDQNSLVEAIKHSRPDEIYNFAGVSFIPTSLEQPSLMAESTALGVTRLLEAIRTTKPDIKFYQSSSSELFGRAQESPQNENTPLAPRNHYGIAKAYAHWVTLFYRQQYNLFASIGICYNHESPRRGIEFLPRKVSDGVARIKLGKLNKLKLGNLEAKRDWGFAGDFVEAMWMTLQQNQPDTYVIGTGILHSVRELVDIAFNTVGLNYKDYVISDPTLFRHDEGTILLADCTKAKNILGWHPKTSFNDLIQSMVLLDLKRNGAYQKRLLKSLSSI